MKEPHPTEATRAVDALVARYGKVRAHEELDRILDQLSVLELAAITADWSFWARPKQVLPEGAWRSFGYLTGRGTGKTTTLAHHIVQEAESGRAMCIGLAAQNEDKTVAVQVAGLLEASPPWFRPEWIASSRQLVWPNGAVAWAFTPEVPGAIRSPNFHLCWLSEVQSWPTATREEALLNFQFATRVGYARTLWDATPKRRHPILRRFLARAVSEPDRHIVIRGTTWENRRNLGVGVIEDLEREYAGTQQGREELEGEMTDDSAGALFRDAWIQRCGRPDRFDYRVVAVDPAVTSRKGSDTTGIVESARGHDGRAYVLRDESGRHDVQRWAEIVLDIYASGCDLVIAETNKGGDLVANNLRAAARGRGLTVVVIGRDDPAPQRLAGTVFVREVHARGAKEERAQPVATAYEKGRVSHVVSSALARLEETLTTWEPSPGADSPGDLDALVHGVTELLRLGTNRPDARAAMAGVERLTEAVRATVRTPPVSLSTLLGGGHGRSGRI